MAEEGSPSSIDIPHRPSYVSIQGAIMLDGRNLLELGLDDVRGRIAAIPQARSCCFVVVVVLHCVAFVVPSDAALVHGALVLLPMMLLLPLCRPAVVVLRAGLPTLCTHPAAPDPSLFTHPVCQQR